MIFSQTGPVVKDFYVLGVTWAPVYLLHGPDPVLFEAGFACLGRVETEAIRLIAKNRSPQILFLTHVHYDHCGGAAYLQKAFPGLRVAGSQRAGEIICRPNAQELIRTLSENMVSLVEGIDCERLVREPFEPFVIDLVLRDGDVVPVGGNLSVQVLETPGHTRDLLSYYIPERKILIASDASGCADLTGEVHTEFLADYDLYLSSLRRLAELEVEVLCQGHHFVYVGTAEVRAFFERSIMAAEAFREQVETFLQAEGGDVERVMRRIRALEYDSKPQPKQPEQAYLLSLRTRVRYFAEKARRSS